MPIIDTGLAEARIDLAAPSLRLHKMLGSNAGALVSFCGVVRGKTSAGEKIDKMTIEHYPGMTDHKLEEVARAAAAKWDLQGISLRHRIGVLSPGQVIVHLVVASAHRKNAFEACMEIVDWLKTDVPLWKKEEGEFGSRWVVPSAGDSKNKTLSS